MPKRIIPLVTGQIYHVFNRSIDGKPIFTNIKTPGRTIQTIDFYRFKETPVRLAYFLKWPLDRKNEFLKNTNKKSNNQITIYAYCLMSNHFHFLLKQSIDNGISRFMSNFQNSITRYINTLTKRKGHIFQSQFKSVLIESAEQLNHVARYIHLNPFSSYLVKNIEELKIYRWSSLPEYLNNQAQLCDIEYILSNFKDSRDYWKFIKDHSDYQRKLESIKHLILE